MKCDEKKLIDSWFKLQYSEVKSLEKDENFWAYEVLDRLCEDEPERCLHIIENMCSSTDDEFLLANIAAGPLEDLLVRCGDLIISKLEDVVEGNEKMKKIIPLVWKNDIDEEIWDRLDKYKR